VVPNFELVTRIHVLTAIREHDLRGAETFLADHGFDAPGDEVVVERGKKYDAGALLAFACAKATGTAMTADQVPLEVAKVLTDLGFKVASIIELSKPAPNKRVPGTRAPAPKTAAPRVSRAKAPAPAVAPERPPAAVVLCPKCFTQVPSTGLCDYCD
jgi:hypothetical protein